MPDDSNWERTLLGRAKAAFNKAKALTRPPPGKAVGQGSVMVKATKPAMNGPKPPYMAGLSSAGGKHTQELAAENKSAMASQASAKSGEIQRPVIESGNLKEAGELRKRFQKAAEKDRDKGR